MTAKPSRAIGLFPTPLLHAQELLPSALVTTLRERFVGLAGQANAQSRQLAHTAILPAHSDEALAQACALALPRVAEFGELLFGERLNWHIKEMWFNVLEPGGHQAVHNHANSFVSGVIYLTANPAQASTVFVKALGQPGFVFENTHAGAETGPFNAGKWVMPAVTPGDLVLFPSHLLHEVPTNPGPQRVTLAFNAIPDRLDAWGYRIGFTA